MELSHSFPGGVKQSMWKELPKPLMADFGFQGCIASIELNGEMIDPMKVRTTYEMMVFLNFTQNFRELFHIYT